MRNWRENVMKQSWLSTDWKITKETIPECLILADFCLVRCTMGRQLSAAKQTSDVVARVGDLRGSAMHRCAS